MKEDNRCLVVEAFTHFHAKFYAADVIPPLPLPSPFLPKQGADVFHVSWGLFLESPKLRVPQERGTSWFCIFGSFNDVG